MIASFDKVSQEKSSQQFHGDFSVLTVNQGLLKLETLLFTASSSCSEKYLADSPLNFFMTPVSHIEFEKYAKHPVYNLCSKRDGNFVYFLSIPSYSRVLWMCLWRVLHTLTRTAYPQGHCTYFTYGVKDKVVCSDQKIKRLGGFLKGIYGGSGRGV